MCFTGFRHTTPCGWSMSSCLEKLLLPVRWAFDLVRGPRQPALGCLSNEELDRILSQDRSGPEDRE